MNYKQSYFKKLFSYTLLYLNTQLFITLISLPVLCAWGIPISVATCIGNILFAPFLTCFLFISSLLFFTQLLCIPNIYLAYILEYLTSGWIYLLSFGSKTWLITISKSHLGLLCFFALLAFILIHIKKISSSVQITISLGIMYSVLFLFLFFFYKSKKSSIMHEIPCNKKIVQLLERNKAIIAVDSGALGRSRSSLNWIEYTLAPYLAKNCGTQKIDHFILLKPRQFAFQALERLSHMVTIKNVYIPYWNGIDSQLNYHFYRMKKTLEKQNTHIIRLKKAITLTPYTILFPTNEHEQFKNVQYKRWKLEEAKLTSKKAKDRLL